MAGDGSETFPANLQEDLQDSGFTAFSEETKKQLDGPYYRYFTDNGEYWDGEEDTVTALFDSNWKKGEVADEDDLEEMDQMSFHTKPLELTVENVLAYARYVFDDQSLKLVPAKEYLAEMMQEYGYGEEDGTVTYRCSFTPIMKAAAPAGLVCVGLEAALWVWAQAEDEEEPTWHRFRDIYTGDEAHYDAVEYLLDVPEQMWASPSQRIGISQLITSNLPIQGALAAAELERRYGLAEDSVKPLSQDELDREIVLSRRMETR